MKNRIFSLILVLLTCVQLTISAGAVELPQERPDGCSIEVTVQHKGKPIKDGKLTAILVGYMDQEDYNYFFRRVFQDDPIEDVGSWGCVNEMELFFRDNKHKYDFWKTDAKIKDGKALFDDLATGLYLIIQKTPSTGYSSINPFLVSVPYWDGSQYQYDVDAKVKTELTLEPSKPTEPEKDSGSNTNSGSKPPKKLPQTGQLTWPIPVLTVAGMVLFALGWWLCFDNRKGSR